MRWLKRMPQDKDVTEVTAGPFLAGGRGGGERKKYPLSGVRKNTFLYN